MQGTRRALPYGVGLLGVSLEDWTGIAPNGDVITGDSSGNAENHGHYDAYLP